MHHTLGGRDPVLLKLTCEHLIYCCLAVTTVSGMTTLYISILWLDQGGESTLTPTPQSSLSVSCSRREGEPNISEFTECVLFKEGRRP